MMLISAFVFTSRIVPSLFFQNSKIQASSNLQCLYSSFCVGPGRKPKQLVLSCHGSIIIDVSEDLLSSNKESDSCDTCHNKIENFSKIKGVQIKCVNKIVIHTDR